MHGQLLARMRALTDEAWDAPAPYRSDRPRTLGERLGSVLARPRHPFAHASAHLPDLEAYVASVDARS